MVIPGKALWAVSIIFWTGSLLPSTERTRVITIGALGKFLGSSSPGIFWSRSKRGRRVVRRLPGRFIFRLTLQMLTASCTVLGLDGEGETELRLAVESVWSRGRDRDRDREAGA